jgi:hypothetical protein
MGESSAVTFASVGALLGGKSALSTLALTGAGFVAGSMLDAENAADLSGGESESVLSTELQSDITQHAESISATQPEKSARDYSSSVLNVGGGSRVPENTAELEA